MILADKQIIARILKYSLEEFSDYDISDIVKNMDEPVVSSVRVEPEAYGENNFYYSDGVEHELFNIW